MSDYLDSQIISATITLDSKIVEKFVLKPDITAVGRAKDNDIVIDNPSVSRYHLFIQKKDGKVKLKDLGSGNGTYVNGVKVEEAIIKPDDLILIGKFILKIEVDHDDTLRKQEQYADRHDGTVIYDTGAQDKYVSNVKHKAQSQGAMLRMLGGEEVLLDKNVFTIGKGADADIEIKGLFTSEHQAKIVRLEDGTFRIFNMGNFLNPTKVNGRPVTDQLLHDYDVIEAGTSKFIFLD
ncbi:MAG TPA: FHA domain-containing protein [Thermodesulfobacteriota bacterium]|jgi:pSer/pThr/pTyr-binding forkhead associated (FHA) protein|nr:FHA domain-containing protein [Thermodesulfobacteriota bacterium]